MLLPTRAAPVGPSLRHRGCVVAMHSGVGRGQCMGPPPRGCPHHGAVPTLPPPPRAAGGRVLQLPAVREEDAGRYTCEASNEAGRDRVHYELEVLGE